MGSNNSIGCGCECGSTESKCTVICDPVEVTGIANSPVKVCIAGAKRWVTGPAMALQEKTVEGALVGTKVRSADSARTEIQFFNQNTSGMIWIGPSQYAVENRQGFPLGCGDVYILENYCGPLWAAVDAESASGSPASGAVLINEFLL